VASSTDNNYLFTGKERDAESNLDFFLARYYSSQQGRFLSPDPENAGASRDDPQSWNGYAYARNNPLLYTDPDGLAYFVEIVRGWGCSFTCQCNWGELVAILTGSDSRVSYGGNQERGTIFFQLDRNPRITIGSYHWFRSEEDTLMMLSQAGRLAESGIKGSAKIMAENAAGAGLGAWLGLVGRALPNLTRLRIFQGTKVITNWAHRIMDFRPGHIPPPGSVEQVTQAVTRAIETGTYVLKEGGKFEGVTQINGVTVGFAGRFVEGVARVSTVFAKLK
jgi:RHS repeat-associated protein